MLEESRRIIDDLKSLQEHKTPDTQSRMKELGRQEELESLRRDNLVLRDRLSEVGLLKSELENLRRKLQSYEESQRSGSGEELDSLRAENRELRRRIEEFKHKNQLSNDRLREDNEKLLAALEKDKRALGNLDYEMKKLGIEKENLEDELRAQKERHSLDIEKLKSKLEKRDSAKRELEQLINELQKYKADKEDNENKRSKKYEDIVAQNKFLKDELESITNELEALRKLYLEQNKRLSQASNKPQTPATPARRLSSSGNSPKANHSGSTRNLTPATRNPPEPAPMSLLEKFLLSLEISRLHFAYLNCRCKQPCSDVCQLELSPQKDSRFRLRSSERREPSPSYLKSPSASSIMQQGEISSLIRERDNLKLVLADYQKKLLEARRQLEGQREQSKENRQWQGNQEWKGTQETAATQSGAGRTSAGLNPRELELQIKVLMAENARLANMLARQRGT